MKCKFCESEIPEGAEVCPQCGLDADAERESETTGKRGKKQLRPLLVIGVIAVLACAVFGVSSLRDNRTEGADAGKNKEEAGSAAGEDGMDGDLDGIGEVEVTPAEAVSALGESWESYTVQINGKVIALPCEYKELQEAGLSLDEDMGTDDGGIVSGKGYSLVYLMDQKGNTLTAEMINPYEEEKEVSECLVGSISLGDYDLQNDQMSVVFPGEIEIGTAEEDVLEKYGKSQDPYEDEEQAVHIWMDEEKSYAGVEAYFDAKSRKLVQIVIRNYGF